MSNLAVLDDIVVSAPQHALVLIPPIIEEVVEEEQPPYEEEEDDDCDHCDTEFCFDCPNMLDQLPTYNYAKNSEFIHKVKMEIARQEKLKAVLEADDDTIEINMTKLKEFVGKNATNIADQLNEIKGLSTDLKRVFADNQTLKDKHAHIAEMHDDEQLKKLASKIKDIKSARAEIGHFLDQHGVVLSE